MFGSLEVIDIEPDFNDIGQEVIDLDPHVLTLFYMGSRRYVVTWGGGSPYPPPPLAKAF